MKNFISVLFILVTSSVYSQLKVVEQPKTIEVGKIGPLGMTTMILSKNESGSVYCLDYKDIKFKHISEWKKFCFINENNDVDNLYNMIIDGFEKMPEKDIKLESQLHYIYLHFEKNLGVISFQFYAQDKQTGVTGESAYMQKKQVMKLFGKTK